jgi:hypothetical protein
MFDCNFGILKEKKSFLKIQIESIFFLICINHYDNPWKILILIMVRIKRRGKRWKRRWKERQKKGGKKLEGLYVGEGFVLSTF